jgi:hypothetical protein
MKNRRFYRRRETSDTWHFNRACRWWPRRPYRLWRTSSAVAVPTRPSYGELCNECVSKAKRAK